MRALPRLLLLFTTLLAFTVGRALAQSAGDSEDTVRRVLSEPSLTRSVEDHTVWMYADGTKVVLKDGVVLEYKFPGGAVSTGSASPAPRAETRVEAERPRPRTAAESRATRSRNRAPFSGPALVLLIAGVLVILVCNVIFIIAAFSESVLWGLGVLFVPFVSLVFLVLHWDEVKKPFLISLLVGGPLIVVGMIMQVSANAL